MAILTPTLFPPVSPSTHYAKVATFEQELNMLMSNLKKWMQPEQRGTPMLLLPASSETRRDPFGVVLVIGPFNYPLQVLLLLLLPPLPLLVLKPQLLIHANPHINPSPPLNPHPCPTTTDNNTSLLLSH